jgi:hypothetical protein
VTSAERAAATGALLITLGATSSGPLGFALVALTHPQPPWQGGALFARSFHPIQTLPFYLGFVLITGFGLFIAALHRMAAPALRVRTTCSLIATAAFTALIAFNYILQTTFVPGLAARYTPASDAALAIFSMSCPSSLAWALEMWGYGLLGVATWLAAPVLGRTPLERWTARGLIANGAMSIAGALLTALIPGWVLSPAGLAAFGVWNVLVIATAAVGWLALRAPVTRQTEASR